MCASVNWTAADGMSQRDGATGNSAAGAKRLFYALPAPAMTRTLSKFAVPFRP
jgi:hypothetical protein